MRNVSVEDPVITQKVLRAVQDRFRQLAKQAKAMSEAQILQSSKDSNDDSAKMAKIGKFLQLNEVEMAGKFKKAGKRSNKNRAGLYKTLLVGAAFVAGFAVVNLAVRSRGNVA